MQQNGEVERFVQLFAERQAGIQAYLWTLVANRDDADDLMQKTSASLWRTWPVFDPPGELHPWACGVTFIEGYAIGAERRRGGYAQG